MLTYKIYCPHCGKHHEVDKSIIAAQQGKIRSEAKIAAGRANAAKAREVRAGKRAERLVEALGSGT
jgi:uncharacterized Zn finger protein (UPF0148 family)